MNTTLNKIKSHALPFGVLENLLKYLGKASPDDEDLPILTVLDSNGLDDALLCLLAVDGCDIEKRRFALFCAKQVQYLLTDEHSRNAILVADLWCDGKATDEEMEAAYAAALSSSATYAKRAAYAAEDVSTATYDANMANAASAAYDDTYATRAANDASDAYEAASAAFGIASAASAASSAACFAAYIDANSSAIYAANYAADTYSAAAYAPSHAATEAFIRAKQAHELRRICELSDQNRLTTKDSIHTMNQIHGNKTRLRND